MWLPMIAPPVSSALKHPFDGVFFSASMYTVVPFGMTPRSVAIDFHGVTGVPTPTPNTSG